MAIRVLASQRDLALDEAEAGIDVLGEDAQRSGR